MILSVMELSERLFVWARALHVLRVVPTALEEALLSVRLVGH